MNDNECQPQRMTETETQSFHVVNNLPFSPVTGWTLSNTELLLKVQEVAG